MPATSASQQRLMGMVHAYQQGKLKKAPAKIKDVAKHISKQDAKDFAKTKASELPEHVKEAKHTIMGMLSDPKMIKKIKKKKISFKDFQSNDASTKKAFELGFNKRAAEYGIDGEALLKQAKDGSSWLGRYFASGAMRDAAKQDKPWSVTLGDILGQGAGGFAGAGLGMMTGIPQLAAVGAQLGSGAGSIRASLTDDQRAAFLKNIAEQTKNRSYGDQLLYGAKKSGPSAALLGTIGALLGSVGGGALAVNNDVSPVLGVLGGAGVGGLAGAGAGATSSALAALINKAIINNTSDETHKRTAKMQGAHPYATGVIPFGDVVGSALA